MSGLTPVSDGLGAILEIFDARFEFDALGRILLTRNEGDTPRFVLGRSAEGCVWRFAASLERPRVIQIAKLAGREPGFPSDHPPPYPPPERLVMIERVLKGFAAGAPAQTSVRIKTDREVLERDGLVLAEIWTLTG